MAKNVSNNETLEVLRTSYNDLVDEVGGLGTLRTNQKGSIVDAVNSIVDQYFFFQDFEYDGSDGANSNRTFSGTDNLGETLQYSANRLLVFKNGLLLRNGTDYSATNGTSVTLTSSAANSDIIRITSFTGSYEGVAGATQAATTQWTKTGGGSIYNHDTESGVVINSDDQGVVTTPASGYGIQLESDGSNIYLNTGSTSNKVFINGDLDLASGAEIQINGSKITSSAISGFDASARGLLSAGTGIAYNSSTGVISASGSADTTGNAATATALETARTIHGVSFDGTANIDLTEVIQDTVGSLISGSGSTTVTYNDSAGTLVVSSTGKTTEEIQDIAGAMFSSNTETGITATYQDGDGTIDLVIGNDAIVSSMIADNTIVGGNIAANTIGSSEIAANAINASELADDAVDTDAIVDNAVTLGTKTSGNYVGTLAGTSGQIATSGNATGEGVAHTLSLENSGVTAGNYGSSSAIPQITVDAKGRITSATTATVSTLTTEQVEDIVGAMVDGGTETRIGVTYDDTNGRLNFVVDDMTANTEYTTATSSTLGLVKIGYTENGKNYPVELSNGQMYVNVPWVDTNTNTTNFNINANGGTNENISSGEVIRFDGGGATSVSRSGNTITISSTDTNTDTNTVTSVGVSGQQNTGTITLQASGASSISQSGNTITISSTDTNTDTNTTYSAGSGLTLSGTTFSVSNSYARNMNQDVRTTDTVTFGEVRSTGNVTAYYSDDRLKDRQGNIESALDKVSSLNGFYFKQNEKGNEITPQYADKLQVGVSAQEIKSVLPEVVVENAIDGQYDSVHYDKVVPLLIEAIKELKSEIESLKS